MQKGSPNSVGPELETLKFKGEPLPYASVLLADKRTHTLVLVCTGYEYILGFDTRTGKLTPWVVWLDEPNEWDKFAKNTSDSEMVKLVK